MSAEVVKPASHDDLPQVADNDLARTAPDIEDTVANLRQFLDEDQAKDAEEVLRRMQARAERWHEQPE